MRQILTVLCASTLFFAACRESDFPVGISTIGVTTTDSTYILPTASIPAADAHNVLVEEFTGQSCTNCPSAHTMLEGIAKGGNVNIIGLYMDDPSFTDCNPPPGAKYDFRSPIATHIADLVYGTINGVPIGGIDRTVVGGTRLLGKGDWAQNVKTQKDAPDSVNLAIESSYNGSDATIRATITYLNPVSTPLNISIVIVEDSMVDLQYDFPTNDTNYLFKDVFRDMVSAAPLGDAILDNIAVKEAGRVYWRKYTYKLPAKIPAINPAHCRVIAFVNTRGTGGEYHVLQSAQTRLKP